MTENTLEKERPLSPHLQVYRLPYNALMSISGRAVGIILALVITILLGWFVAVVNDPALYDATMTFLASTPYDTCVFLGLAFLTFFYIGNGIRHWLWDMGIGVNEKAGILSGNIVLVISLIATIGLWNVSCMNCGMEAEKAPVAEGYGGNKGNN